MAKAFYLTKARDEKLYGAALVLAKNMERSGLMRRAIAMNGGIAIFQKLGETVRAFVIAATAGIFGNATTNKNSHNVVQSPGSTFANARSPRFVAVTWTKNLATPLPDYSPYANTTVAAGSKGSNGRVLVGTSIDDRVGLGPPAVPPLFKTPSNLIYDWQWPANGRLPAGMRAYPTTPVGGPVKWVSGKIELLSVPYATIQPIVGLQPGSQAYWVTRPAPVDVSDDGNVIIGNLFANNILYPLRWDKGVLSLMTKSPGATFSRTTKISGDGKTIIGATSRKRTTAEGWAPVVNEIIGRAIVWRNGVAKELPTPTPGPTVAASVSADGKIINGYFSPVKTGIQQRAQWVNDVITVFPLQGKYFAETIIAASDDGKILTGTVNILGAPGKPPKPATGPFPARWVDGKITLLPLLNPPPAVPPPPKPGFPVYTPRYYPTGISSDGESIIGVYEFQRPDTPETPTLQPYRRALVWEGDQVRLLDDLKDSDLLTTIPTGVA